ncbi:phosphoprotein [Bimbo virus]|uniref:Phosphoprotein n=1 Tax=Bimbo virus TaxID=864694 RepID=A0AAE8XFV2_9RHAB|nr:phosphoprotein [Bimbo virus]UAU42868.1 phosphoprotein [Bimbo virus]WAD86852.1 phosphoprotein [Bimbo virus]
MNQDLYRIQRTKAIFDCIKNEAIEDEESGRNNTDSGGVHGFGLPSSSRGSAPPEPFQMGETNVSTNGGETLSDLVWGDESNDEKIFQNPDRDKDNEGGNCFQSQESLSGRAMRIDENWQNGYTKGLQDAIGKIIDLRILPPGIELELKGFEIIAKKKLSEKSQLSFNCEMQAEMDLEREKQEAKELLKKVECLNNLNNAGIQGISDFLCSSQSPEKVFEVKPVSEEMILNSEQFLDLIEDGLHYSYKGFEKYICLSEVRASKFKHFEDEKMSLHEWITKTCFD